MNIWEDIIKCIYRKNIADQYKGLKSNLSFLEVTIQ